VIKTLSIDFHWIPRIQDRVEIALIYVERTMLFILFLYVTADVTGRDLFHKPLPGTLEISQLLIAATAFLGVSYAQARRGHIGLDLIAYWIPSIPRMVIDTILLTVSLITISLMSMYMWKEALFTYQIGDVTPDAFVPIWWSKALVALGFSVMCIRFLIQITQDIVQLRSGQIVSVIKLDQEAALIQQALEGAIDPEPDANDAEGGTHARLG
jgi:TRAP-type C4-dicarboxylate transport system permease small subunit